MKSDTYVWKWRDHAVWGESCGGLFEEEREYEQSPLV